MRAKDVLGRIGEALAVEHLSSLGMTVIARNWRCDIGEIDIVAQDGEVIVICEVRTRSSDRFGQPLDTVTPAKMDRLRKLATRFLHDSGRRGHPVRIDVVGIIRPRMGVSTLRHVRGAA